MSLPHPTRLLCAAHDFEQAQRVAPTCRRALALAAPFVLLSAALALSLAGSAYASFERVATFGESGQGEISLSEGVAVNDTTGDIYVASGFRNRVMRFDSRGNFLEMWGWGVGDKQPKYERCGPDGELIGGKPLACASGRGLEGEGVGEFWGIPDLAVDQGTGDVYVASEARQHGVVQIFSKEGQPISSFGELKKWNEPVSASPDTLHKTPQRNGMAIDEATGDVYILDSLFLPANTSESRLMVFEPQSPGNYEHYVYAGRSHDLFAGVYAEQTTELARSSVGDFYLSKGPTLYGFDNKDLATPLWEVSVPEGAGIVVEPASGDLLRYAVRSELIERLSGATGSVLERFGIGEEASVGLIGGFYGLAYNPDLSWEPGRPPGVLYGVLQHSESGKAPRVAVFAQPAVAPPTVDSESASFVGSTSATLTVQIDPKGYATRFRFQYGTEACSSGACAEAPVGGADLGSGSADLAAGAELLGLKPETTYRYRVLATNAYGDTVEGPEQTFTTYPALTPGLPDGRVYELVSPAEKNGGEVFAPDPNVASCVECKPGENSASDPMQSAPDGNSVVYEGTPFTRTGDAIEQNEYLSRRTATGWQTEDLSPATDPAGLPYGAVSADLSTAVLQWDGGDPLLSPEAPAGYANIYLRAAGGGMHPLLTSQPVGAPGGPSLRFAGSSAASADFSHVVFEANYALTGKTPFAPPARASAPEKYNVYEWFDGGLRLVNVLPGNTATVPEATVGEKPENYEAPDATGAVSKDGSRIFWTDQETGQVYVRENGESTVEIPDPARFLAASSDGSKVLLRDGLIFDLSSGTPIESANLTNGREGFQGILGASKDLARVYFVDTEALTGEERNGQGAAARAGQNNLYLYEADSGTTRFLATLTAEDDSPPGGGGLAGDWKPSASNRVAQVTSDGRYLAFVSYASLTGYENKGYSEVFEYDAETGRLACTSCNPTGVPPLGGSRLSLIRPITSKFPQPRYLSDNGRLFFDSSDVLSPYDGNGSIEDVYEYEPEGIGSCTRTGGCIFLISSGHSPADSNFVAASPSGSDVFFTTRDRLVPVDQDQLYDLYDARVSGGFPELTAPSCNGTGCQGVPGAPPIFATPSSVTFAGVGNFDSAPPTDTRSGKAKTKKKPAKCSKVKKLKHSRCAKPRTGKSSVHRTRHTAGRAGIVGNRRSHGGRRK